MYKWILPSLSEVLANSQSTVAECSSAKAQQQWRVSIAATEQLLLNTLATALPEDTQGLVLAAPAPVFSEPTLAQSLQTVTFTAKPFNPLALMPFQMPAGVAVAAAGAAQTCGGAYRAGGAPAPAGLAGPAYLPQPHPLPCV